MSEARDNRQATRDDRRSIAVLILAWLVLMAMGIDLAIRYPDLTPWVVGGLGVFTWATFREWIV